MDPEEQPADRPEREDSPAGIAPRSSEPTSIQGDSPDVGGGRSLLRVESFYEHYSGPLPHPQLLERYEKLLPGATERIFALTEREQQHAHEIQRGVLDLDKEDRRLTRRGQAIAAFLATLIVICGTWVAIHVDPWAGAAIIGIDLAAVVSAFIWGERTGRKLDEEEG
jgi:uncharacterized membrane protein